MNALALRVVARHYHKVAGPVLETSPRKPGINSDGTVTLLHGTTALNAELIREQGFKPISPESIAATIAEEYGLKPSDVFNSIHFDFPKYRTDRDRTHFTSKPETAQQYTVPEVVQDALSAVWFLKNPPSDGEETRQRITRMYEWMYEWVKREGHRLAKPEILAITMPWEVIGAHAFGRPLTLEEYLDIYGDDLNHLHSISVPMQALHGISIAPFGG
jgi:hypothetical protein